MRKAANFILSDERIISLATGVFYLRVFPKEDYDFWPHFLLISFFRFVFQAFLIVFISIGDKSDKTENKLDYGKITKPTPAVIGLWTVLVIVTVGLYIPFNIH